MAGMFRTGQDDPQEPDPRRTVGVLTVDDQDYFRGVMREVVEAVEEFRVVGEASSGEAALISVDALSPDLVIMDKRMRGMGGLETCRRLIERHPQLIVLITSVEEPNAAAIECGAAAFVRKVELTPRRLRELWREHGAHAA